jgi:hypothetical protein
MSSEASSHSQFGYRQHPLAHQQAWKDVVRQVCRRLHHAPGLTRGTNATALTGEGDEIVMPRSHRSRPGQNRGQRCRTPDLCETRGDRSSYLGGSLLWFAVDLQCCFRRSIRLSAISTSPRTAGGAQSAWSQSRSCQRRCRPDGLRQRHWPSLPEWAP